MKEKLYTIPLTDAFKSGDECPFCFLERDAEQRAISFILGSAYMEDDIREETDKIGFCRHHYKMMFDYGNQLGNAMMLHTYMTKLNRELHEKLKSTSPAKTPLLKKLKKSTPETSGYQVPAANWLNEREKSCYVCNHFRQTYPRYVDTFFELIKTNDEFTELVRNSNGICLPHFKDLLEQAPLHLNEKQQKEFYQMIQTLMEDNMKRVEDDLDWFIKKYDYRYKDEDWKNSRDSVQRGMQKIAGGHPADPVFQNDR